MGKNQKRIGEALIILVTHIDEIHTVREWAEKAGYADAKQFARLFKQEYKAAPVHMLWWTKATFLTRDMSGNPQSSLFDLADEIGLRDEVDLNKFLNYHLKMSPTQLRDKVRKNTDKGKIR